MSPPKSGQFTLPIRNSLNPTAQTFTPPPPPPPPNQSSKAPVDTPNQTPTKDIPSSSTIPNTPRASTKENPPAPAKDSPPTSIEGDKFKSFEFSTDLGFSQAMFLPITFSTSLPFGKQFRLNEPRALSIHVPANFDLDKFYLKAYPGDVDFSDGKQVQQLECWRIREIQRALIKVGR
ncbi:hypothetical protein KCU83_g7348, partial [Aureobasidium melanogenum]